MPDIQLSTEQKNLIKQLMSSFKPSQRAWLSGYLKGLQQHNALENQMTKLQPQDFPMTIIFGTETGNAEEVAQWLSQAVAEKGWQYKTVDMSEFDPQMLSQETCVIVITATHGEGEAPESAKAFEACITSDEAPKLNGLKYAVLALGDTSYETFCEYGRTLDQRFSDLGAERMYPRIDCDIDFEEDAKLWCYAIIGVLESFVETTEQVTDEDKFNLLTKLKNIYNHFRAS